MIIKLTEDINAKFKYVYYAVYADKADLTFIIKHTFEAAGANPEKDGWLDVSEECVGWHYGKPNSEDESTDFIGSLKKTYGERIDNDFLNDFIDDLTKEDTLLKVEDSGNTVSEKRFKSRKTFVSEDSEIPAKVRMPRIIFDNLNNPAEDVTSALQALLKRIDEEPEEVLYKVDEPSTWSLQDLVEKDPTLLNKIVKKFKKYVKDFLDNYTFNKENALNYIISEIKNNIDTYVKIDCKSDLYEDTNIKNLINTALNKYVEQVGTAKAYATLFECYHSGSGVVLKQYKSVSAKEINRPEYSSVVSSSFSTYYYYKVIVAIGNETIEFIDRVSDYYSGGWN